MCEACLSYGSLEAQKRRNEELVSDSSSEAAPEGECKIKKDYYELWIMQSCCSARVEICQRSAEIPVNDCLVWFKFAPLLMLMKNNDVTLSHCDV